MKRALITALERIRMDILDAIVALEADDVEAALDKIAAVAGRLDKAAKEIGR